jgi:hypothetical protein
MQDQERIAEQIEALLIEADADIVAEIRSTRDAMERQRLLNELDALERVKVRLHADWGT